MSLWERIGEGIGYGLAAVVLGPSAAMQRRARRAMRRSFAELCERRNATRLVAPKFMRRASMRVSEGTTSIDLEAELDIVGKRARATASIAPLPSFVRIEALKGPIGNLTAPLAIEDGIAIESPSLDANVAVEIARAIAKSALGTCAAFELVLGGDRIDVTVVAPTTAAEWNAIAEGLLALATWLGERWPSSYRS